MNDLPEGQRNFLDLFRIQVNRRALCIALGLRSVQQLCGSTAITFYCKTIFQENEGYVSANTATITYFSLQAVLVITSSFVVDIFGRRPMFIFSLAGTTITLFMAGLYLALKAHTKWNLEHNSYILMVSLLLNVAFFSLGVRNVPLLVMSEVFHPKIKPTALCFATIYYAVLAVLATKFYHVTTELVEMAFPLFSFSGLCLISLVLYCIYVPETKGKTLEDIQKMLQN